MKSYPRFNLELKKSGNSSHNSIESMYLHSRKTMFNEENKKTWYFQIDSVNSLYRM